MDGFLFFAGIFALIITPRIIEDMIDLPALLSFCFVILVALLTIGCANEFIAIGNARTLVVSSSFLFANFLSLFIAFILYKLNKNMTPAWEKEYNSKVLARQEKIDNCFFKFSENNNDYCCKNETTVKITKMNCDKCIGGM